MANNPRQLGQQIVSDEPKLKQRDDEFNQKMSDYHAKRQALMESNKYLEPEWDNLVNEMQQFRSGYEKPKLYSAREYMLDNDPNEFQIDKIRDDIDFQGLWDEMKKGRDFYEVASVDGGGFDSDVREKIFNGMADTLGLDYDDIYYKWLGKPRPKSNGTTQSAYKFDNGNEKKFIDSADADDNPLGWATRVLEEPREYGADDLKTAQFIIDRWGKK